MERSCCIWKSVPYPLTAFTGESPKISRRRVILATSLGSPQPVLEAKAQELKILDSRDVSRRKTLLYLTAGVLGGFTFLNGEGAEARVGRQENRRKALEKLREKAKQSEPKSGNQKKENEKEKELFPLLPPRLPQQAIGPVVEANLLQFPITKT